MLAADYYYRTKLPEGPRCYLDCSEDYIFNKNCNRAAPVKMPTAWRERVRF